MSALRQGVKAKNVHFIILLIKFHIYKIVDQKNFVLNNTIKPTYNIIHSTTTSL